MNKPHTWTSNQDFCYRYLSVIENNSMKTVTISGIQRLHLEFIERFQLCVAASIKLMPSVSRVPEMFLPLSTIVRTIITDIVIFLYLDRVDKIAGEDGVKSEVDIIDYEFTKGMKLAYDALIKINQTENVIHRDNFIKEFDNHFDQNGKLISKKEFHNRYPDAKKKLDDFVITQGKRKDIRRDTERGKIEFLDHKNIHHIDFIYTYLNQLHHYSRNSRNFFKPASTGEDYQQNNIDYTFYVFFFMIECALTILSSIDPSHEVIDNLEKLRDDMYDAQSKSK